jgi:two-component system response regulator AlgR
MLNGSPTVLIVDDEAPARARLRDLLAEAGGWTIVAEAANGKAAFECCVDKQPDVVLLDIRMPGMDGIEVASHLAALPVPPAVIFTTAYDEYAVRAFDTHAVGYLLKPVRRERLMRALEHAARISRIQLNALAAENPDLGGRRNISVSSSGNIRLVPVDSVVSFHADQKYVRMLYMAAAGPQEALLDEALKSLEAEFAADFVRIHRNSLVRVSLIAGLTRNDAGQCFVHMASTGDTLPVSRRHLSHLKQLLQQ